MKRIGIVVPCYNEEDGIPTLASALKRVDEGLQKRDYGVRWIFVDDGSTDDTYPLLQNLARNFADSIVRRHENNRNLGAALRTGFAACDNCEFICSLDSDCTYDPMILLPLLEKLEEGADLVTASPYHPLGKVEGVPCWRLFLSKSLSFIYRILTGSSIHTFTAMVRAQRYLAAKNTSSERDDFTYLTDVLLKNLRRGYRVAEIPATLRVRRFGVSKMRTVRTILRHLELLTRFLLRREAT